MTTDSILDDPFHAVAFAAFVQQARLEQGWPNPEKTRQRAYTIYEAQKRTIPADTPTVVDTA